jgi:hypothetical protein
MFTRKILRATPPARNLAVARTPGDPAGYDDEPLAEVVTELRGR